MSARLSGCVFLAVGFLILALLLALPSPPVGAAALDLNGPQPSPPQLLSLAAPLAVAAGDPITVYLPMVGRGPDLLVGVDLGTLGGPQSTALDVNRSGEVVGYSTLGADQPPGSAHAFLWQDGVMRNLGVLGGIFSEAVVINEEGQIAGVSEFRGGGELRGFHWSHGRMVEIGALDGVGSWAADINSRGQVVGGVTTAAYDPHCYLWQDGEMIDLGTLGGATCFATDINDRGQIVGYSTTAASGYRTHAFLWEAGKMIDLTPTLAADDESRATVINERGQVGGYFVGAPEPCAGGGCAFLWENGVITDLFARGEGLSVVDDLNDQGQAVGFGNYRQYSGDSVNPVWDALRWDDGVLTPLGVQRGSFAPSAALHINEAGQIIVDNGLHAYLWRNGTLVQLAAPDTDTVHASALDDAGHIVGYAHYGHALLWNMPPTSEP